RSAAVHDVWRSQAGRGGTRGIEARVPNGKSSTPGRTELTPRAPGPPDQRLNLSANDGIDSPACGYTTDASVLAGLPRRTPPFVQGLRRGGLQCHCPV